MPRIETNSSYYFSIMRKSWIFDGRPQWRRRPWLSLVDSVLSDICWLSRESSSILWEQYLWEINSTPSAHTGGSWSSRGPGNFPLLWRELWTISAHLPQKQETAWLPTKATDICTSLEKSTQLLITDEGHTGISDSRSIKWEKETQTGPKKKEKKSPVDTLACN